jgi:predicted HD phosphohydrolase
MRLFYLAFPIRHALRDQFAAAEKVNALRSESPARRVLATLRPELSWIHYRLLLGVDDLQAREWYLHEAADHHWSTRQLERQISVLYYERLLASRDKKPVRQEARWKIAQLAPEQFIRDPYVLEFLDLRDYPGLRRDPR